MTPEEFRTNGHKVIDWVADYLENIEQYPVKSQVKPGDISATIADHPPEIGEPFEELLLDVQQKILPGITHWQHPNFHAYFNANNSHASILAELITAAIGAQCMIWETSPAAAELEEKMMNWLKELTGLPADWHGVIQDTASTGTLVSILTAREKATHFNVNNHGFSNEKLRVYCSAQTHSSIDKAIKISGIGLTNLVKIPVDQQLAMVPHLLEKAIQDDLSSGFIPCCIVTTLGTTSTTAMDPLDEISDIALKYGIWHHVDAAYAGTAFILPEYRHFIKGIEKADTYLFNPHKWMFTNFDCTAYYVKDKEALIQTFEILPEYLKTGTRGKVNDYRDWGIQLGRRFRALKLWFVIREYGASGIRTSIKEHIELAKWLEYKVIEHPDFEMVADRTLSLVVFRYCKEIDDTKNDAINEAILAKINKSGKAYITHTKVNNRYVLRVVTGQTNVKIQHIEKLWAMIQESSKSI
ncbi:MAG: aspartate aminotransferase family protein [Flammeovirgaceae bacterium]|jgi:aromatic-L-amino-acid/L-tryptophan decarboxylase|nr:aspartate aminotransferase family protein [Flammeovirgaceae bacterium]|tara:strand:- start:4209 stop:5615 length:1407 start_codon:yes stop_codon:yes gene_type:complete